MKEVSIMDIERFVHHVVMHPFNNIDEVSKMYFDEVAPSFAIKNAVIPELLSLPFTKRALVTNIVRDKVNYEISPIDESDVSIIRMSGESLQPIYKKQIAVVEATEVPDEETI
jgi:hypothetical protein